MPLRVIMLGDVVGRPGRRVVQQRIGDLRREHRADLIVANAENAAGGSGLTPQIFRKLLSYGVDGVTLGDHAYRQRDIVPALTDAANLIRPANLPASAAGRGSMTLAPPAGGPPLHVTTVLGRMFMNGPAADDPFAAADRFLEQVPPGAPTLIEIHAEATGEKLALAHHLDGRASAVVGTHTHVPTADARILPGGTAYISDLGMTGPYDSVLGRRKDRVIQYMSTAMPTPFDVAEGDVRLCGVLIEIGDDTRATGCERIELPADPNRPPFV